MGRSGGEVTNRPPGCPAPALAGETTVNGKPLIEALSAPDFPAALARELARAALSQSELARRCGITREAVRLWLIGSREPGMSALCKVADALCVTLDALRS